MCWARCSPLPALWRCSRAVQEQIWTSTLVAKEHRWTIRRGLHKVALPKLPSYPLLVHSINTWGKKSFCFQICFLGLASHLLCTLHPTQTLQRLRQAVVGARRICQGTEAAGDILGSCCAWSLSWWSARQGWRYIDSCSPLPTATLLALAVSSCCTRKALKRDIYFI